MSGLGCSSAPPGHECTRQKTSVSHLGRKGLCQKEREDWAAADQRLEKQRDKSRKYHRCRDFFGAEGVGAGSTAVAGPGLSFHLWQAQNSLCTSYWFRASQRQIHLFWPCFETLRLDPENISTLPAGAKLGFVGCWRYTARHRGKGSPIAGASLFPSTWLLWQLGGFGGTRSVVRSDIQIGSWQTPSTPVKFPPASGLWCHP